MARKAIKDTFGTEMLAPGVEVQRVIVAGQMIPPTITVDDDAFEEVQGDEGPVAPVPEAEAEAEDAAPKRTTRAKK